MLYLCFIGSGSIVLCPFVLNFSIASLFATIQRELLDQSIWRNQLIYLTFQYTPMYVSRACFYVLSITLDRLVLCTPSVLRLCWNFL